MLKLITRKKRKFNYGGSAMGTTSGGGIVDAMVYTPSKLRSSMAINPIVTVPELQYRDPNELTEGSTGTTTPTGTQSRGGGGGNPTDSPGFKIDMDKLSKIAGKGHTAAVNNIIGTAEQLSKDLQNVSMLDLNSNPEIYKKFSQLQDLVGPNSQNMLLRQVKETESQWAEAVKKQSTDSYVSKDGHYLVKDNKSGHYLFLSHEDWLIDRASGKNQFSQPLTVNELKSAYDLEMSGRFASPEATFNKYLGYNVGKEYIQNQLEKMMDNISASAQKSDNKFFQAFGQNQFNETMVQSLRRAASMETNKAQVEAAVNGIARFLDPSAWETIMAEAAMKINPKTLSSGNKEAIRVEKMQAAYQVLIDYFAPKNYTKSENLAHSTFDPGATTWVNAPRGRGGSGGASGGFGMDFFHRAKNFDPSIIEEGYKREVMDPNDISKRIYVTDRIPLNPQQAKQLENIGAFSFINKEGVSKSGALTLSDVHSARGNLIIGDKYVNPNSSFSKIYAVNTTPTHIEWRIEPNDLQAYEQSMRSMTDAQKAYQKTQNPQYLQIAESSKARADSYKKWFAVMIFAGEEGYLKDSEIFSYHRTDPNLGRIKATSVWDDPAEMKNKYNLKEADKAKMKEAGVPGDMWFAPDDYHTFEVLVPLPNMQMSDPTSQRVQYYKHDSQSKQHYADNSLLNIASQAQNP